MRVDGYTLAGRMDRGAVRDEDFGQRKGYAFSESSHISVPV